jgi:hypothetical protein
MQIEHVQKFGNTIEKSYPEFNPLTFKL